MNIEKTETEKRKKISELKEKLLKVKSERDYAKAMQLALKLVLNGSYGAFCHPAFSVSNGDIANAITASSREVINWMLDHIEDYFYNHWGRDNFDDISNLGVMYISKSDDEYFIHRKDQSLIDKWGRKDDNESTGLQKILEAYYLTVNDFIDNDEDVFIVNNKEYKILEKVYIADFSNIEPIPNEFDVEPRPDLTNDSSVHLYRGIRTVPIVIYGDTDSLYVSYTPIMKTLNYNGDELKFILHMNSVFTQPMFNKFLDDYAKKYGVKSLHDFELETVNKSALHIQKKHYINNVVWEDGVFYEDLSHFYPKGVEIVKSSTPLFVRENIWEFIKHLFKNPDKVSIKEILKIMKNLKKEFKLADIEDISMTTSLNNYDTRNIDDQTTMETVKGAHFSIKAATLHNYILNKNTKYKERYDLLHGGRIKWYFTKNDYSIIQEDKIKPADRFAFLRSFHPTELTTKEGIELDYDLQFEKTFLSIANRFIEPIGLPEINKRLSVLNSLFSPNKKKKKQLVAEKDLEDPSFIPIISSDDLDYIDGEYIVEEEIIDEPTVVINKGKEANENIMSDDEYDDIEYDDFDVFSDNNKNEDNKSDIEYDDFWN
jgi:DNA polymerase elongation subunit (family B)